MLRKIREVQVRFQDAHFSKSTVARNIIGAEGDSIGFIDTIEYRNGRLRVQGWLRQNALVILSVGLKMTNARNVIARVDVSQILGTSSNSGFDLEVPVTKRQFCAAKLAALTFQSLGDEPKIPPVLIDFRPLWKARLRTNAHFIATTFQTMPTGLRWIATRAPSARAKILDAFGINPVQAMTVLNDDLFAPAPTAQSDSAASLDGHRITILLPVYDAFDLLPDVLSRVTRHTDVPFHLILIEDASPDRRVRPFLRDWVAQAGAGLSVDLIENEQNLGFIGSVNSGLDRAMNGDLPALPADCVEGPIVLFNSDAFVPAGWASRLIAPLLDNPTVATTTPMSNDAEIMSVPIQCKTSDLADGDVDRLDAAAARLNLHAARAFVPTGVGFCMAMSRNWLTQVPNLDPVFGRGYGEEVDWCQKVRALGAHHLALGNLFVEHRGGSSFGSADKLAMIANNNGIVSGRYPNFDAEVQTFIAHDPLLSPRFALAVTWAGLAARGPVPVYLAHTLGGGAESYLVSRLERDLTKIGAAIVLRVGGAQQWGIEVHAPGGVLQGATNDTDLMVDLLDQLGSRHVIYSCGVGAPYPASLPSVLLRLHDASTDRLSVLVHDFYMISPSYTLLGSDGMYRGPNLSERADTAHGYRTTDGKVATITQWQAEWHALLAAANTIETFSHNSAAILRDLWPDLAPTITVTPHTLPHEIASVAPAAAGKPASLGVLGGINFAKGASVVERIAKDRPDLKITIIGKVDPYYSMPNNVTIHGSYAPADIPTLAQRYAIAQWLIPSIWPETFSFTTHEALATGLPVIAFDLGAQGDAVSAAPNGVSLPFDPVTPPSTGTLATSVIEHLAKSERPQSR
jgi:GT2 family glycosyltransferase